MGDAVNQYKLVVLTDVDDADVLSSLFEAILLGSGVSTTFKLQSPEENLPDPEEGTLLYVMGGSLVDRFRGGTLPKSPTLTNLGRRCMTTARVS